MKKQDRGAVLTSVILMVLVMTLIGVPLLGMVVFNYRVREMDNSLRRSEYETEIVMDKIYLVIRESVIQAIEYAKMHATESVNATSELQRTQYAAIRAKYEDLWIKTSDNYNGNLSSMLSSGQLGVMPDEVVEEIEAAGTDGAKEIYVNYQVMRELSGICDDDLSSVATDELYVGSLVDSDDGMINDVALKDAYNSVFEYHYHAYLESMVADDTAGKSDVIAQINREGNYDSEIIVSEYIFDESEPTQDTYLKINTELEEWFGGNLNIDVAVRFRKDAKVLPAAVSATFIVGTPQFDSVTNVEQHTVALSNPITNQGVTVGGTLNVTGGTTLQVANDIMVATYDEYLDKDVDDGIVLDGSKLIAMEGGSVSNSRISVNGDILMKGDSQLISGNNPLYYRNLYVGKTGEAGTYDIAFNGNVVAKDDLEINTDGAVTVVQSNDSNYYGFNDENDEGPDSSSAIVVNSAQLTNKSLQFGNLYLAGRAFIDGALSVRKNYVEDTAGEYIKNENGEYVRGTATEGQTTYRQEDIIYKTGESIAVRGNYIAYQTPLSDSDYASDKVNFGIYFIKNRTNAYDKTDVPIYLADAFVQPDNLYEDSDYKTFDTEHKWQYFMKFASDYATLLKKLKVSTSSVKYMEGAGFNTSTVIAPNKSANTAFKENLAVEYEKYTKYFGYRPVDGEEVDVSKAKTKIFGRDGWISTTSPLDSKTTGDYQLIYDMSSANKAITLSGNSNKGIIVVKGNLEITVTGEATFSGMIVVGGTLTINGGGTLTLTDSKEEVVNTIIGNYMGENSAVTGEGDGLYQIFTYDGSGTTYIVTEVNDSFINVNELINITNWKKQDVGRL